MADMGPLEALAELVAERLQYRDRDIPKKAMTRQEAADSLGISLDTFERYIQPELRVLRIGRKVLVPMVELDAWIDKNAALTLPPRRYS
jgi:excisionase family DNA binding protein